MERVTIIVVRHGDPCASHATANTIRAFGSRTLEDNVRRLLQEISEELCEAIGESSEVGAKLAELRDAGYTLNLLLDCKPVDDPESSDETSQKDQALLPAGPHRAQLTTGGEEARSTTGGVEPRFRINADDLAFLRSVGIDPTRQRRSKSSTRTPGASEDSGAGRDAG